MCWATSFLRFEVFAALFEVLWDFMPRPVVNIDVLKEHTVSVFKICQCKKSNRTSKYGYVMYQSKGMVAPQICFYTFAHAFLEFYCILTSVYLLYICIIEAMTIRGFLLVQIDYLCIFTVKVFLLACYVQL